MPPSTSSPAAGREEGTGPRCALGGPALSHRYSRSPELVGNVTLAKPQALVPSPLASRGHRKRQGTWSSLLPCRAPACPGGPAAAEWPTCLSRPFPLHAGPCPLPASSSWCFREECTKATVVSRNTSVHCPPLPWGPAGLGSRGCVHLNPLQRLQGPACLPLSPLEPLCSDCPSPAFTLGASQV